MQPPTWQCAGIRHQQGLHTKLHTRAHPYLSSHQAPSNPDVPSMVSGAKNLARYHIPYPAAGPISHSLPHFSSHQVPSNPGVPPLVSGATSLAHYLEAVFRSLNNLSERFHHSFFLYLQVRSSCTCRCALPISAGTFSLYLQVRSSCICRCILPIPAGAICHLFRGDEVRQAFVSFLYCRCTLRFI